MHTDLLEAYARLLVKTGVNLQQKQVLVISSPIECADFARLVAQTAYKEGAYDVIVNWVDELFTKIRFSHAPEEVFEQFPEWQKELYISYMRKGAAFISIAASDPELLKDINPSRIAKAQKARSIALQEYMENLMSNRNTWCVASLPTKSWAKKVFSGVPEQEAIEKLWETILHTVRVDTKDPINAWEKHINTLKYNSKILNSRNFKYLHFKNSLGTDLRVELPENHIWIGGSEKTPEGIQFIANMPTEEVFTLPQKTGVNGKVISSKPFNYHGNLIENFSLSFEDGRIVDYTAENGHEHLKNLIETDEGSHYLGEVALVPYESPISQANLLFYNTLFDENASCHLAIGKAYPVCIKNGEEMSPSDLEKCGVNNSLVHEDFMIGTKDLEIIGVTSDGKEIQVFKAGNFAWQE